MESVYTTLKKALINPYEFHDPYLDEKIRFLQLYIGEPLENYIMPDSLKRILINDFFNKESISALVLSLMRHLKLTFQIINIVLITETGKKHFYASDDSVAGEYISKGTWENEIHLHLKADYSFYTVVAVICHEITHHYMTMKKIQLLDKRDNENLTDVAAIYLGFGYYISEGYKPYTAIKNTVVATYRTFKTESYKIGYLNDKQIDYVMTITKKLRIKYIGNKMKENKRIEKKAKELRTQKIQKENELTQRKKKLLELQSITETAKTLLSYNFTLVETVKSTRPNITQKEFSKLQANIHNIESNTYTSKIHQVDNINEKSDSSVIQSLINQLYDLCDELSRNNATLSKFV